MEGGSTTDHEYLNNHSENGEQFADNDITSENSSQTPNDDITPLMGTGSLIDVLKSSTGALGLWFMAHICSLYTDDPVFKPVIELLQQYSNFKITDGLIYLCENGKQLLCMPKGLIGTCSV